MNKMIENDSIDLIVYRILNGEATAEEILFFSEWVKTPDNKQQFDTIKQLWNVSHYLAARENETIPQDLKSKFIAKIKLHKRRQKIGRAFAAVSSVAAIFVVTVILWNNYDSEIPKEKGIISENQPMLKIVKNDEVVIYSSKGDTTIVRENQLTYDTQPIDNTEIEYNEIYVPKGKRIMIILSDGTKMQINSDTKVKYPVSFPNDKRVVEVDGNAFFDVAKDASRPFSVICGDVTTTALGTVFEVENYNKDNCLISLVNGSVSVENYVQQIILSPNTMATIDSFGQIIKKEIDGSQCGLWQDNTLVFKADPIQVVLDKLSRWHNTQIINNTHEMDTILFTGKLPDGTIEEHLAKIAKNIKIKFIKENEQMIIWN